MMMSARSCDIDHYFLFGARFFVRMFSLYSSGEVPDSSGVVQHHSRKLAYAGDVLGAVGGGG